MGPHVLSALGVVLALLGLLMLAAPRAAWLLLRLAGVRPSPHGASRVAAWGLVVLGGIVAVLGRAVA